MNECKFCELCNKRSIKNFYDRVLYENNSFIVTPALGSVVEGYLMVISKRHINSMCYLNNEEKSDYIDLINTFRELMKEKYNRYPILFEHGSADKDIDNSASSIYHAHCHIVAHTFSNEEELKANMGFEKLENIEAFFRTGFDKTYIFYMNNNGDLYVRLNSGEAFQSQSMRIRIAEDVSLNNNWNWKTHPHEENMMLTVDKFKKPLREKMENKLKYIYYCRAMDGMNHDEVRAEYMSIEQQLMENGLCLVNSISNDDHTLFDSKCKKMFNKENAQIIVSENLRNIAKADCVLVNLSMKNHLYVGCIAEMIYSKLKGCYTIVVAGDSGADKYYYTLHHADLIVNSVEDAIASITTMSKSANGLS